MGINRVIISGNLTRDAELRSTQSGLSVLNFGIAVNDRVKNQQTGEWTDRPNFIDCVLFGKRADSLANILHKGSKIALEGKLRYSSWENDQGQKRSKLEVLVDEVELMSQRNGAQGQQNVSYGQQRQQQGNYANQQQYAPQNGSQQPTGGYQQQYQQQQDFYAEDCPF